MAIASSLFFIVDLEEEGVLILPIPPFSRARDIFALDHPEQQKEGTLSRSAS